jgi:AcrR family transcriptional regulator
MPKLGMAPIRRQQLVEAAISVIHEQGFDRATVARIARRAGVSSGMVHHYFKDKDELLFATMRHLLADLRSDATARLKAAVHPSDRIRPSSTPPSVMRSSTNACSARGWRSMAMPGNRNACSVFWESIIAAFAAAFCMT